jgi:hypothetical protein
VGDELAGTIGGYAAVASGSGILRGAEGTPVRACRLLTAKTPAITDDYLQSGISTRWTS